MKNLSRKPTWELRNMVRALSMHSWLNTPAESQRLALAKHELDRRNKNGFVVGVNSND
jgi:hypothetical protein